MARFRPGLRMTILVALLVPLTLGLGFWQLDRAAQKRAIEEARLASYGALPLDEHQLRSAGAFSRVRIEGDYDGAHQFLIDNNTRKGVSGYAVVTVFETIGGQRVLVNRGWTAAPVSRDQLPEVSAPEGRVRVTATRWSPSSASTDTSAWGTTWPMRVQHFDGERMSRIASAALPNEWRLEEGQPGSLAPIIIGAEMSASRHTGYAVQWFAMAAALVAMFVVLGLRRGTTDDD
jgi:cytochrome oxidase assembly protein ShyY1